MRKVQQQHPFHSYRLGLDWFWLYGAHFEELERRVVSPVPWLQTISLFLQLWPDLRPPGMCLSEHVQYFGMYSWDHPRNLPDFQSSNKARQVVQPSLSKGQSFKTYCQIPHSSLHVERMNEICVKSLNKNHFWK